MNKKTKFIGVILAILVILANVFIWNWHTYTPATVTMTFTLSSDTAGNLQVFYSDYDYSWVESNSTTVAYQPVQGEVEASVKVGAAQKYVRIDTGEAEGNWTLKNIKFSYGDEEEAVSASSFGSAISSNDIESFDDSKDAITISAKSGDPYVVLATPENQCASKAVAKSDRSTMVIKILAFILLNVTAIGVFILRKKVLVLPVEIFQNRRLILKLAKNDFKTKYAGSYLGIFWAFVQPVVTILVYFFVFSVGFRSGSVSNVPFVVYLVSGLVPWFFIQDYMNSGTNALIEYSYLVKKVVFKISVLPMVKAISAFFVHAFFIAITILIAVLYGINPGPYVIQVIYYFFAMFVFGLGIVYGTCAIVIFFRDLTQIINIILQVGVWTIPIMWDISVVDEKWQWLFKVNPMYYIVNGYRESIYGHTWFWHDLGQTVYFWAITLILFVVGTVIFKRLKIHFADVL